MRKFVLSAAILLGMAVPVMAQTALEQDITGTGFNQGDLVTLLQNIVDDVNNLKDAVDEIATAMDSDSGITYTSYSDKIDFSSSNNLTLLAP